MSYTQLNRKSEVSLMTTTSPMAQRLEVPAPGTVSAPTAARSRSAPAPCSARPPLPEPCGSRPARSSWTRRHAYDVTAAKGMAGRFLDISIIVTAVPHGTTDDLVS